MKDEELFDCTYLQHESKKVLVSIDGKLVWVPKIVMEGIDFDEVDEGEVNRGDEVCISIAEWWCKEEGII